MVRPGIVLCPESSELGRHCSTDGRTMRDVQQSDSLGRSYVRCTYLDSLYLPIHKLILRRGTFESLSCEVHRVPRVVNLLQHLHGNHRLHMVRQLVNVREMVNHVGPRVKATCTEKHHETMMSTYSPGRTRDQANSHSHADLLPTTRFVLLLCEIAHDRCS